MSQASEGTATESTTRLHLELEDGYRFRVEFGGGLPPLVMDEPPPLGDGSGPNASATLGAALANCLSASLLYCLRKAHIDVEAMTSDVEVRLVRNERHRLRVGAIDVRLSPRVAPADVARMGRCLELFEDFCVATEAVRGGIEVDVSVSTHLKEGKDPATEASGL